MSSGPIDILKGPIETPWSKAEINFALSPLVCTGILGQPDSLAGVRHQLERWVSTTGLPDPAAEDLVLAGYEALVNAAEHAYPAGPGPVNLVAACDTDGRVLVIVSDHGRWRPPPLDPGSRGRGLLMIKTLSQRAEIQQSTHGTTVYMQWWLPTAEYGSGTAHHE